MNNQYTMNLEDLYLKNPKILVLGDLMIDHYLMGRCDRISPEAPVQVVSVENEKSILGGAGNVVNNLISFGAQVDVISVVGDDIVGEELSCILQSLNKNSNILIKEKDRTTTKKTRILSSGQQIIRFDKETVKEISNESHNKVIQSFEQKINFCDVVVFSDYGKGFFTKKLTIELIKIAKKNNKKVLVDPKGLDYSKYAGAYLLTPNLKEASDFLNIKINDDNLLEKAIIELKKQCNLQVSIITLSERGIAVYTNKLKVFPTKVKDVFDVTGAGDTVIASLAFCLASGKDIYTSLHFSNLAAGIVVGKIGSSTASLKEVLRHENKLNKIGSTPKIITSNDILQISNGFKEEKKKIVFTNGCFDILHVGHIKYLEQAKKHGDILIVGLNSDYSVRKLKGTSRPINNEDDRAYILAALEQVDFVIIFEEETPFNLIKQILPDVLVKGGDYKGKKVIGQDIANELVIVDFIEGKSTSNIIEMLK